MGRELDLSLKRSIFVSIIDPGTKRDFIRLKKMDDYSQMRREMSNFMCHELDAGTIPMDISSMDVKPGGVPTKEAVAAAHEIIKMSQGLNATEGPVCGLCPTQPQNPGRKPLECWNCGGPHPARMCEQPLKKEVAEKLKGLGKGGGTQPAPSGGYGYQPKGGGKDSKGAGKGNGKGKGKGGKGLYALGTTGPEWGSAQWGEWNEPQSWPGSVMNDWPTTPLQSMKSFNALRRINEVETFENVNVKEKI